MHDDYRLVILARNPSVSLLLFASFRCCCGGGLHRGVRHFEERTFDSGDSVGVYPATAASNTQQRSGESETTHGEHCRDWPSGARELETLPSIQPILHSTLD